MLSPVSSRYIDHTHADSILTLTNQRSGENFLKEALGSEVAILPYLTPGLPLAKGVLERHKENPEIEAMVVAHHGIFTFGEDARTAYERMVQYVNKAEAYVKEKARGKPFGITRTDRGSPERPWRSDCPIQSGCAGSLRLSGQGWTAAQVLRGGAP